MNNNNLPQKDNPPIDIKMGASRREPIVSSNHDKEVEPLHQDQKSKLASDDFVSLMKGLSDAQVNFLFLDI